MFQHWPLFPPVYWYFHLIKPHQSICTIILDIVSYFICLHVEAEKSKFMFVMKCNKVKHFSNLRCIKIPGSLFKLKLLEATFRDSDLCLERAQSISTTLSDPADAWRNKPEHCSVLVKRRGRYHLLDRKRTVCVTFLVSFFLTLLRPPGCGVIYLMGHCEKSFSRAFPLSTAGVRSMRPLQCLGSQPLRGWIHF